VSTDPENPLGIKPSTFKLIDEALLIQEEDAQAAGTLGFMARAMVMATLPHKNPKTNRFTRKNGNYTLSISAPFENVGLPYGTYPRLLLAWISTEAVKTKKQELVLGKSLSGFMSSLGLIPTGGRWGTISRLKDQMDRLLSANFACRYDGVIANRAGVQTLKLDVAKSFEFWWEPKNPNQGSLWDSTLTLSTSFYDEVISNPIPVDLRALKALKGSAMALDIYTWATWRVFTARGKKVRIPWPLLQAQFGSAYADTRSGQQAFRRNFMKQLMRVKTVYPDLNIDKFEHGILLLPSRPHIKQVQPVDK
jgi:hypothetical protein